ncbi:hypothetical protein CEXT_112741, partial [Caerostris extrusa]
NRKGGTLNIQCRTEKTKLIKNIGKAEHLNIQYRTEKAKPLNLQYGPEKAKPLTSNMDQKRRNLLAPRKKQKNRSLFFPVPLFHKLPFPHHVYLRCLPATHRPRSCALGQYDK